MKWNHFKRVLKNKYDDFSRNPHKTEADMLNNIVDHMTLNPLHLQRLPEGTFKNQNLGPKPLGLVPATGILRNSEQTRLDHHDPNILPVDHIKTLELRVDPETKSDERRNLERENQKEARRIKWQQSLDHNPNNGHYSSPQDAQNAFWRKFETAQQTNQRLSAATYGPSVPFGMNEEEYQAHIIPHIT